MSENKDSVTHLVGLSELESISIVDGVGARDERRREDNFSLKGPVILRMRLVLGTLSLEMLIVKREITINSSAAVTAHWAQMPECQRNAFSGPSVLVTLSFTFYLIQIRVLPFRFCKSWINRPTLFANFFIYYITCDT